jgi:hypothetical protein
MIPAGIVKQSSDHSEAFCVPNADAPVLDPPSSQLILVRFDRVAPSCAVIGASAHNPDLTFHE